MKKKFKLLILVFTLLSIFSINSFGVIATVDVGAIETTIAENLKTLQAYAKQLKQLEDQFNEIKKQGEDMYHRFEGNINIGDLLNTDTFFDMLPKEANDTVNGTFGNIDLGALRSEFNLKSDDSETQKKYDTDLKKLDELRINYKRLSDRTKKLQIIQKEAEKVTKPSEKQDITNKLLYELVQQINERMKTEDLRLAIEQEEEIKYKAGLNQYLENEQKMRKEWQKNN